MFAYLELLRRVRFEGDVIMPARGLCTQKQGDSPLPQCEFRSLFHEVLRFRLAAEFPIVTTRFVDFRHVVAPLRGLLSAPSETEGALAENLVRNLRIAIGDPSLSVFWPLILTSPSSADHSDSLLDNRDLLLQFHVRNSYLSCSAHMCSTDLFMDAPIEIACYALLTHLLAKIVGLRVGDLAITFGAAILNKDFFGLIDEQLRRTPRWGPMLHIKDHVLALADVDENCFDLIGYEHRGVLSPEVAV